VLVALSVINAFNFIDGIDGLAASNGPDWPGRRRARDRTEGGAASGGRDGVRATLGFLLFQISPLRNRRWRTFMGDAGSTLLGFLVVWFALSILPGRRQVAVPGRGALVCA